MSREEDSDDLDAIRRRKVEKMKQQASTPDGVVPVEDEDHLDQLIADHSPLLLDFYADWCGPCKLLEPTIEYFAAETPATVAQVDVDELQRVASDYGVQSIPTVILFADGSQVDRFVGAIDETEVTELIETHA